MNIYRDKYYCTYFNNQFVHSVKVSRTNNLIIQPLKNLIFNIFSHFYLLCKTNSILANLFMINDNWYLNT